MFPFGHDFRLPSRPHDTTRRTVYLDTSTLSKAFRAAAGDPATPREFANLKKWIESVSVEANLVLSYYHLVELSAWSEPAVAHDLVAWLDSLDTVWSRITSDVTEMEEDQLMLSIVGHRTRDTVSPFAPSRLSVLEDLKPEDLSPLLAAGLIGMFVDMRRDGALSAQLTKLGRDAAAEFHADRNSGVPIEIGRVRVEDKRRGALLAAARAAWSRTDARRFEPDREEAALKFYDAATSRPLLTPCKHVFDLLSQAFGESAGRRSLGSKKFNKLHSTPADMYHAAIGAAYCDVFTCDQETSRWLDRTRESLGRARQLAEGEVPGGAEGFAKALMTSE